MSSEINNVLDLIPKRNFYVFFLLLKMYDETKGMGNQHVHVETIVPAFKNLLGEEYEPEFAKIAVQYCKEEYYLGGGRFSFTITSGGRNYIEDALEKLQNPSEDEIEILEMKAPEKLKEFLKITSDAAKIGSLLLQIKQTFYP